MSAAFNPSQRPGAHKDLIRAHRRRETVESEIAEDQKLGRELRDRYKVFAKAADRFKKGDSVKLQVDGYLLKRDLETFASIETGLADEASYASEWEDSMMDMAGKFFTVQHACPQTGHLLVQALPGAKGSQAVRESEWSRRFVVLNERGQDWALPATAFELLEMEVRCHHGHLLRKEQLAWNQGYVHTRYCAACGHVISRKDERYQCDQEHYTQTRGPKFSVCLRCFADGYHSLQKLDGNTVTKTYGLSERQLADARRPGGG